MVNCALEEFSNELFLLLTGKPKPNKSLLVKKHSENLQLHGDFSFPNTVKSWHDCINTDDVKESSIPFMDYIGKTSADLVLESEKWCLQIARVRHEKDRCHLYLDRPKAIRAGLIEAMTNNCYITKRLQHNSQRVHCDSSEKSECLTTLRAKYLAKSIDNLLVLQEDSCERIPNIIVTSKSSSRSDNNIKVLCGAVLNAKSGGKEINIKSDDYIRMRQNEMTLIAQHKYGVRVSTDSKWKEFIVHLGESAVVFDLLQTKPNSAVKINFDCSSASSSKGAAFILYNCARLEAIIRTFSEKVEEGVYPPLPKLEDIDLSLLTQEDEWCLIFNFIMGLPLLLNNAVEVNEKTCEFRPHHVCSFLSSMVRVFSQYYRKVRILTEPRKHLLPVLYARLHMLKILNDTLKSCLNILNIKSVSQMYFVTFISTILTFVRKVFL